MRRFDVQACGDAFEQSRLKIDRAEHHFSDLDAAIKSFDALDPYQFGPEFNEETGWNDYVIRIKAEVPDEISLVAADCLHNLRSALDIFTADLLRRGPATERDIANCKFPNGKDAEAFRKSALKQGEKMTPAAAAYVEGLEVHYGGANESLRQLHDLDILDKHQMLLVVHSSLSMQDVVFATDQAAVRRRLAAGQKSVWTRTTAGPAINGKCPLYDGDVVARQPATGIPQSVLIRGKFRLALHQPGIVEDAPVRDWIRATINDVFDVIDNAERLRL